MPRILIPADRQQQFGFLNDLPEVSLEEIESLLRAWVEAGPVPPSAPAAVLADQPVCVGGVKLYMPSISALKYLETTQGWYPPDSAERILLESWILAHGRRPATLARLACKAAADRLLGPWSARIGVTLLELLQAVEAACDHFPNARPVDPENETAGTLQSLALAASLAEKAGGTVHGWLWDASAQMAFWVSRERQDAEAEMPYDRPSTWNAVLALRNLRRQIRARRLPAEAPEGDA